MTTSEDLLTVREVARRCHRSEETVRRWIWSGKLNARKLGNQLYVSSGDMARLSGFRPGSVTTKRHAYTKEELLRQIDEDEKFADEMFAKYGYVDVTELLRQVREDDD